MPLLIFWKDVWLSIQAERARVGACLLFLSLALMLLMTGVQVHILARAASMQALGDPQVFSVSLYQTLEQSVKETFDEGAYQRFLKIVAAQYGQKLEVGGYQALGVPIFYQGQFVEASVIAIDPCLLPWLGVQGAKGRFFERFDGPRKVALLGHQVAQRLAPRGDLKGPLITNKGSGLTILGVLPEKEAPLVFGYSLNESILIPLSSARRLDVAVEPLSFLVHYEAPYFNLSSAQAALKKILAEQTSYGIFMRDLNDGGPLQTQLQLLKNILGILSGFLGLLSLTAVYQLLKQLLDHRRQELGLRMVVGASSRHCIQFIGAQIGLLALAAIPMAWGGALVLSWGLTYFFHWPWAVSGLALGVGLSPLMAVGGMTLWRLSLLRQSMPVFWLQR